MIETRLNEEMHLEVHRNQGYNEVSVDLVRNGRMTPLVLVGMMDEQDDLHVHVYREESDEPMVFTFDPEKCDFWTNPRKESVTLLRDVMGIIYKCCRIAVHYVDDEGRYCNLYEGIACSLPSHLLDREVDEMLPIMSGRTIGIGIRVSQ